jgi:hypothetical protein
MSLRLKLAKGALTAFALYACAKANDSDLAGRPESMAGRGGAGGTATGGKGGTGGTSATGGASGQGGTGATGGTGGSSGVGGSSGAGGTAGMGEAGGPACGETTDAGLVVVYWAENSMATADKIHFHLYFQNQSDSALQMSRVSLRYWMSAEPEFDPAVTDYAGPQIGGQRATYVDDGDLSHLLITFTGNEIPANNGDLNPTEVQFRIQPRDGARFDQSNDYSFAPQFSSLQSRGPNERITAYVDNVLAWGQEPSGRCPGTGEGGMGGEGGQPGTGGSTMGGEGGETAEAGAAGGPS